MLKSTKRTLRDPLNDVKMCGSKDDTDDGSTAYTGPHFFEGVTKGWRKCVRVEHTVVR